jgi:glycosyltransferase involved in cell wall biosynthesis
MSSKPTFRTMPDIRLGDVIREPSANRLYIHVPTPGDHYSSATGSAIMTVIYELSRQHEQAGGRTRVIVGHGTRHDYPVGECVEVGFSGLPSKYEKQADAGMGALGFARRFATATYEPALGAIEPEFDGPVFLHNNPGPLRRFKKSRPQARCGLYVHNAVFRTYTRRELDRTIESADFIICVSEFIANDIARRLGRRSDKLIVIYNGVDLERFHPVSIPADVNEPVVLFLGRVIPEKGPDMLLRAAHKLLTGERQFRVRIVGSSGFSATDPLSPYERHLRVLAETIPNSVEFHPFVDRQSIIDEYSRATVFCVPSNFDDPCPLTVSEALACGLPTIASRRGGIPEVGGDAVLYFRPPSVDELAERIAYLLDDESARADWGRRARERAATFSWGDQYERLRAAIEA